MSKFPALFIWVLLLIQFQQQVIAQFDGAKYMFIGHCYEPYTAGDKVDHRLETFDFSEFDGIWLGGDVCSEAMLNYSTVAYIDGIFNLGNPETHWSLGNHDARQLNWEWCEEFTNRKTYYTYASNGITRIVINSNLVPTNCEMLDEQFDIINAVCDTINMSSNLILLIHHDVQSPSNSITPLHPHRGTPPQPQRQHSQPPNSVSQSPTAHAALPSPSLHCNPATVRQKTTVHPPITIVHPPNMITQTKSAADHPSA